MKFIYWFAYYNLDSPSVRYRAKYPLDFFKEKFEVNNYFVIPGYSPNKIICFLKAYFSALFFRKANSLIVIQRVQSNFIYATLLKLLVLIRKKDTVYDIDDADYFEKNPNTMYFFSKKCDKISAGSHEIARHLSQFNDKIIHTTSPIIDLNIIKKQRNFVFTIGWIGGFGGDHKQGLIESVFPAIKALSLKLKFVLIGISTIEDKLFIVKYFNENPNIEIEIPENIDWNNEKEIQGRITNLDLGIATLLDNPIQLSKSGIKAKQYMNNGVPVLSTDLPENNNIVVNGKNGFLCANENEFKDKIYEFYSMTDEKYFQFSKNARESIVYFDHNKYFRDFEKIKNFVKQ